MTGNRYLEPTSRHQRPNRLKAIFLKAVLSIQSLDFLAGLLILLRFTLYWLDQLQAHAASGQMMHLGIHHIATAPVHHEIVAPTHTVTPAASNFGERLKSAAELGVVSEVSAFFLIARRVCAWVAHYFKAAIPKA